MGYRILKNFWDVDYKPYYYGKNTGYKNGAGGNIFYKSYFFMLAWVHKIGNFFYGGVKALNTHYQTYGQTLRNPLVD